MARAGLDRATITRAALELLDEGGLAAITARALGDRLGVRASALYYHLPDMRALLDEVATALLREMVAEPMVVDGWEEVLRATADRARLVLTRHRDGGRVFAGSRVPDPALLSAMEQPLGVLMAAGLSLERAVWCLQSVMHFTTGFVIEEQHRSDDEPDAYRVEARRSIVDAEAAPLTAEASEPLLAPGDRPFAFGVELLVTGVRALLPACA